MQCTTILDWNLEKLNHTRPGKFDFILQSLSTDSTMDKGFLEWWENMAPQLKSVTAWDDQLQLAAVMMELGEKPNQNLISKFSLLVLHREYTR